MPLLIDTLFDTKNEIEGIRSIFCILFSKKDVEELYIELNQQQLNDLLLLLILKLTKKSTENKSIEFKLKDE